MNVDHDAVRTVVIESLRSVLSTDPDVQIDDDTKPIGNLGLASADGVDLSLELEDRLQCIIDKKANPLVTEDGRRARSVGEIVDWIVGSNSVRQERPEHA